RRDLVLELPLDAEDHPCRACCQAEAEEAREAEGDNHGADDHRAADDGADDDHTHVDDAPYDDDAGAGADRSALAIASASHLGTRVGRSVPASTVACAVEPSAMTTPSRSTAYSYRNLAPLTSTQRACTTSRSSNRAGCR